MRKYVAEALGTILLVLPGTGAIVATALTGQPGGVGIVLAFGLGLLVAVYAFGPISGAAVNPAVTIGLAILGVLKWREVVPYIISQLIGATIASLAVLLFFGNVAHLGATVPGPHISVWMALGAEILGTFILMTGVAALTHPKFPQAASGLSVGLALTAAAFFTGSISGGSFNPARSFGPALLTGTWTSFWIYIVGPVIGAVLAAALYRAVRPEA